MGTNDLFRCSKPSVPSNAYRGLLTLNEFLLGNLGQFTDETGIDAAAAHELVSRACLLLEGDLFHIHLLGEDEELNDGYS